MECSGPSTSHSLLPHWGPDSVTKKTFSTIFRTKVTISCLQVVLGLLQHLDPVLDLQSIWGSWNWSQMIPPTLKHWYDTKIMSQARSKTKVTISLHEVVLGLQQTLHPVLDLQIDMRLLKMVSNDSPYPQTFSLIPKLFLKHDQNQCPKNPSICLSLCGLPVYR